MNNDAFYSTAAQIIATLLIPLVLEFIERVKVVQAEINARAAGRGVDPDKVSSLRRERWARQAYILATVAIVGEAAAMSVLILDTNALALFVDIAGGLVVVALFVTSVAAIILPINRLKKNQVA